MEPFSNFGSNSPSVLMSSRLLNLGAYAYSGSEHLLAPGPERSCRALCRKAVATVFGSIGTRYGFAEQRRQRRRAAHACCFLPVVGYEPRSSQSTVPILVESTRFPKHHVSSHAVDWLPATRTREPLAEPAINMGNVCVRTCKSTTGERKNDYVSEPRSREIRTAVYY
jgi:hypothetical protein